MMLYDDLRRCRRCKRKRMDDEPPEVQQYKTCAKCRIIERTKKKLRKPLAEETMRYGMRQFQEQHQNANFIHDDVFANDQLLLDLHALRDAGLVNPLKQLYNNAQFPVYSQGTAAPAFPGAGMSPNMNYSYSSQAQPYGFNGAAPDAQYGVNLPAYQLPLMGNASPYGAQNGRPGTTPALAAAIAAAAINRTDLLLGQGQPQGQPFKPQQQHYRQFQQKQDDRSRVIALTQCELCLLPIDADDSVSAIYRLCGTCYSDPYSKDGVYLDFNDFLLAVANERKDTTASYISELVPYLVESLNANRQITLEQQFRKVMLESFKLIYLDPLFALLAPAKLAQTFNNVTEVNGTVPVVSKVSHQNHYTLTPPLKLVYGSASDSESVTVELMFVAETNLIIIKKATKKAAFEYTPAFFRDLDSKMQAKGLTFQDDPYKIHTELGLSLGADKFAKDFKEIELRVAVNRQSASSPGSDQNDSPAKEDDDEDSENDAEKPETDASYREEQNGVDPAFS